MKVKSGKDDLIEKMKNESLSKDAKLSNLTRENSMLREMIKKSMTFANTLTIKIYEYDESMVKKNETIKCLKSEMSQMLDQIFDLEMAVSKVKKEERRLAGIERKDVSVGPEDDANQFAISFASVKETVHCETQTDVVGKDSEGTQTDTPVSPSPEEVEQNCTVLFDEFIEESLNESKTVVVKCDSPQNTTTTVAIPNPSSIPTPISSTSTAIALISKDGDGEREIGYMEYLERRKNGFISKDFKPDDEGMFPCPWEGCNHRSKHKWNVVTHYRRHTGEKRYKCDFCPKRFYDSNSCKNHVRSHTGEKPYNCPDCDFKAAQLGSIYQHRRKHCPNRANKDQAATPTSAKKSKAGRPRVRLPTKKRKRVEEVDTESDEEIELTEELVMIE